MKYEIKSIGLEKENMEQVFFFLKNQLVILEVKKYMVLETWKKQTKNPNRWGKQKNRCTSEERVGKP